MFNEVSYLTLCTEKRAKFELCKSRGADWFQEATGILLLPRTQANQNTCRFLKLACATDCYLVDL